MALYKFSIDLSQNLKPEPSPIKTLSDIINGQAQQSLNRDVSIKINTFSMNSKICAAVTILSIFHVEPHCASEAVHTALWGCEFP